MKGGFNVRMRYRRPLDRQECGLWYWFRDGEEFADLLMKMNILPEHVTRLEIQKPGEPDYKVYEPRVLDRLAKGATGP